VNLLGDNIYTLEKTETSIEAGKEVGLEVNSEKTTFMLLGHYQNAGHSSNI
jgi:hypothetical protein